MARTADVNAIMLCPGPTVVVPARLSAALYVTVTPSSMFGFVAHSHVLQPGLVEDAALCYPPCRDGYHGAAFLCWAVSDVEFRYVLFGKVNVLDVNVFAGLPSGVQRHGC